MINVATVFSGIGAAEQALKQLGIEHKIVFACDNGERELNIELSEIKCLLRGKSNAEKQEIVKELYFKTGKPNYVKETYFANYNISEAEWFEDIRFLCGKPFKNKIDLLVGGSPCQSFSVNGKRAGLSDVRGTLFYDYARIIDECKPKVFIYENVRGMLNHDNGQTWETIKNVFKSLNYSIFIKSVNGTEDPIMNSKDYGIPQNRERVFIVGFRNNIKLKKIFCFPKEKQLNSKVSDYLDDVVDSKYYLGEKGFNFVTTHPSRARVGREIMGCQKANQQFNWNGDFIFETYDKIKDNPKIMERAYVGNWCGKKGVCRKFTPRECLRLMGYKDTFIIIQKDEVMYRQAGNSIVVDVLMELIKSIKETGVWENC